MNEPTTSKPKVNRPTKIPLALVIAELKSGKTAKQIAAQYDVTPETVWLMLRRQGFSIRSLQAYQATKADLLAFRQSQVLEAMDHEKISQASLRDQATTFNILHNAERLERGQSTNNINVAALNMELADVEKQIAELEAKLNNKPAS
jgi:hypothetical protein